MEKMLEQLARMFESNNDKKIRVRISHTNRDIPTTEGVCVTVNSAQGLKNHFIMILNSGEHFMFIPENVGADFVDCPYVHARTESSRRRITVMADNK